MELIEFLLQVWNFFPQQFPQFASTIRCLQVILVLLVIMLPFIVGEDKGKRINWVWMATKEVIGFIIFFPYWFKNIKEVAWMTLEPDQKGPAINGNISKPDTTVMIPSHELTPYLVDRPDFMGIKLRQYELKMNASYMVLIRGEGFWKMQGVMVAFRNHKKVKRLYKMLEEIDMVRTVESCALIAQEILKQQQTQFNQDKMEFTWSVSLNKLQATFERLESMVERMSEDQQEKDEFMRFFTKEFVFPRIKNEIVSNIQTLSPVEEHKRRQAIIQQAQAAQDTRDEIFE